LVTEAGVVVSLASWRRNSHISAMPHLETCLNIVRRLIAKGDVDQIPFARRAVDEYVAATPERARKSGLRLLQEDVLLQRNAVTGDRRNFADVVKIYVEKKLEE
jgi:hypothetical protein